MAKGGHNNNNNNNYYYYEAPPPGEEQQQQKGRDEEEELTSTDEEEAVVRHQKLCLSIDIDNRRIYGYTELEVTVPDSGIVGLHADNLAIESVMVDGQPAEFEIFPHYLRLDSENRWCSVSSASSAADAAGSVYLSSLERELVPNLLIMCASRYAPFVGEQHGQENSENGAQSSGESKQNLKVIRIDYWVEKAETGIHFDDDVLHTDNQIRRARCWFPCMDDGSQCCCYDLEFTVANNLVAASTGCLLHQVLNEDEPPRRTYVYKIDVPVAARWISLVVAQFEILPDSHHGLVSHMCLPDNLSRLRNTVGFFHSAFSYYEDYLSTSFPFGSYIQVFIAPEMAISSSTLGASMSIFSSQILFDEKVIDQTIETRIKLAYALARQWFGVYITAASPNDEWLLDGLAGFLTDIFVKQFLGNNEARYRRYKANCVVCKSDDSAATALSCSASCKDLYGTQCIGFFGKIRSWKSVAVLQMLEKQMGPESFRKILQRIVSRAKDTTHTMRTLSSKEFRQFANKVGNLERPFLKEFFPRWIESCGCPVLKMGFSYNKRKNIVELAVMRGLTMAIPDSRAAVLNGNPDSENREGGWPGMMSIRVHELDGMYDHPILPMAGETLQLLEIPCHSKLAAKRFQRPKKGSKTDGSDDNADFLPSLEMRSNNDSPLLWIRADPEMEYLAEINFNQPEQMWINQLEKEKDVVAQAQAIGTLVMLPQLSFSVVNALSSILSDSKAFWRIRIEVAFALANTASEETDWAGLLHLVKFYKSRRFDANIGLPKPNDFRDFPEYFVLKAIPHAIAMVRASDNKSPREAVELILHLLKYNDNNGNPFSDVFWLAALVQSIGELEFGQQNILFLSSLLKRVDRLLQFDRLMPSYNGVLTVSCIRTLTQIALKLSGFIPFDRVSKLIRQFRSPKTLWQVRIEAMRALLDLEFHCHGIDAVLMLFIAYLEEESSLRGQVKLGVHAVRLCQLIGRSDADNNIKSETLVSLLRLLESPVAFNNVNLRHYLFCILQVLAGRPPTLSGVPRDETLRMGHAETCTELKNIFAALVKQSKSPVAPLDTTNLPNDASVITEASRKADVISNINEQSKFPVPSLDTVKVPSDSLVVREAYTNSNALEPVCDLPPDGFTIQAALVEGDIVSKCHELGQPVLPQDSTVIPEAAREVDTISNSNERRKPVFKIRVKQSAASSRPEDADNATVEKSQGGCYDADRGASSSISVDAPQRYFTETVSVSNQNLEDINSFHDVGSRVTASIGSAKLASDGDELLKELQCTADSSKVSVLSLPEDRLLPAVGRINDVETQSHRYASLQAISGTRNGIDSGLLVVNPRVHSKEKEKKKSKDKKRKRHDHKGSHDDPEYFERKRIKKEKKQKAKEMAKLQSGVAITSLVELQNNTEEIRLEAVSQEAKTSTVELYSRNDDSENRNRLVVAKGERKPSPFDHSRKEDLLTKTAAVQLKSGEPSRSKEVITGMNTSVMGLEGGTSRKIKIKLKNRTGNKP